MSVSGIGGNPSRGCHLDARDAVDDARRVLEAPQQRVARAWRRAPGAGRRSASVLPPSRRSSRRRGRPARSSRAAHRARRRGWSRAWRSRCPRAPTNSSICRHCASERATTFGRISVLNRPTCAASSSRSCTSSNGIARLDERLVPALDVVVDPVVHEPRGLLGVDHAHPRQRAFVAQVGFPAGQPAVDRLDRFQPALVVEHAAELGEPRAHAVGDEVCDPEPDFGGVLHRVLPAVRLLDANAEEAGDGLSRPARRGIPWRSSRSPTAP